MSITDIEGPLHKAALIYAQRGIPVFPIEPRGKKPIVPWKDAATTDQDQIDYWWRNNSDCNIGIPTGARSGIVVIDFDTVEAWEMGQRNGLPDAPQVKTGKGYHVYCRYQEGVRNFQKRADLPGIDLRGEGGLVVVPPSVHVNGAVYSWVEGRGLDDRTLGEVPEWVLAKKPEEKTPIEHLLKGVPDGGRTNALVRIAGKWIHEKMPYDDLMDCLQRWNHKNQPPIELDELLSTVNNIWKREYGCLPDPVDLWEQPVLFEGVNPPELKADILPSWLGAYASAVSKSTQTPEGLAVMVALSAIATCVQKRFEVCPYGDDYLETLSIWTVTVLQSSERKTPVFKAMTAPIHAWEIEQERMLEQTINEVAEIRRVSEKRLEKLRADAVKNADHAERQRIMQEISEVHSSMPAEIRAPKLWTGDTTAESLQDLLAEHDERMSVLSDEGGIFNVMAGMYNQGIVNIDIFLQAYSGVHTRIKRKARSVSLSRPALTFGITVQPAVIESFAYGSRKQIRGKGGLGRFLFCIPDSMLGKRDVCKRIPVANEIKTNYENGIRRLLAVPKQVDDSGNEIPKLLSLSDEALSIWQEFSRYIENKLGPQGELSVMSDWGGKLPGNALRIAGLLHLVEHGADTLVIGKGSLLRSLELCDLLIGHAKAAFDMIGSNEAASGARRIYDWIVARSYEPFSKTECHKAFKSVFNNAVELDKALNELKERAIIRETEVPTAGKWIKEYVCNPILL
jgi:putative DNA primase/helicase